MKVKPLGLNDYLDQGPLLSGWMEEIAEQSKGEFTRDVLAQAITQGTHQGWGWCTDEGELVGLLVTSVTPYASGKSLVIVGAAGDPQDYEFAHNFFLELCKQFECSEVEIRGRRGFMKKFASEGYEEKYTVLHFKVPSADIQPLGGQESDDGQAGIPSGLEASAGH